MFKIAIGRTAFSNKVQTKTLTLNKLFDLLTTPKVRNKKDGAYFVFAHIENGVRNADNVVEYYGATIDLDDTELSIDEIEAAVSKYKYVIHTTFSHQTEGKGDRYRLVLPYKEPLRFEEHKLTMLHIMSKLGLDNVDLSTTAISRPMYLPACPKSHHDLFECREKRTGKLFDLEITPQLKFELQELLDEHGTTANEKFDINAKVDQGDRNNALTRFVGKLIHSGMDMNTVTQSARTWNHTNLEPPLDNKEVEVIVNSVYKAHSRKSNKWGYDEIERRIKESDDAVADFELLCQLIATAKIKAAQKEILTRQLAKRTSLPIGTVKDTVKEKGITADEEEKENEEKEDRQSAKSLRREFRDWVYISSIDRLYNFDKARMFKVEGFNKTYQSKVERGTILNLLINYDCIKVVDAVEYYPGQKRLFQEGPVSFANTYRAPDTVPSYGSVRPMLRHFRKLIPNDSDRKHILDYIAFMIQNPGVKIRWMPIIKGKKRVGKGTVIDKIIIPLLGAHNVKTPETRKVKAEFNAWQLDTQLVCFHELRMEGATRKDKLDMTESLKSFLTDNYMLASYKGVDDYQTANRVCCFATTNYDDAVLITQDEGRFLMVSSPMERQAPIYYKNLNAWLESHVSEMLDYFQHRDVSDFDYTVAPENKYTQEVKDDSHLWPSSILAVALKDEEHIFNTDSVTTWGNIVEYVRSESVGKDLVAAEALIKPTSSSGYKLNNAIKELGFRPHSRMRINGRLETVFYTPGVAASKRVPNPKAKKIILKQKSIWDFDHEDEE